jgi:hypothetical protein
MELLFSCINIAKMHETLHILTFDYIVFDRTVKLFFYTKNCIFMLSANISYIICLVLPQSPCQSRAVHL